MKTGWNIQKIGEVCDLVNGGTPKTEVSDYWDGENLWVTPAEMGKRQTPFIDDTNRKLTDLGLRNSSARLLPPYSVILSSRAPIGHLVINTKPMATNQGCKGLIPGKKLDYKFLYYFLMKNTDYLNSIGTGATFKELSGSKLSEVEIPIPPLPEQQRIVRILDEAFASIAVARANAEKNLQNAREVFESYRGEVLGMRGENWIDLKLGDVCRLITDGTHATPKYRDSGIPFLSVRNLTNGYLDFSDTRFISEEDHLNLTKRCKPEKGDVLYTKVGTTGIAQVIDIDKEFSIFVSLALLKIKHEMIFNKFLEHFLNAPFARKQAQERTRGMANKNLVITDIKEIEIHFPKSLEQQQVIVSKLEEMRATNQRLEAIYNKRFAAIDELKKAILHQAFTSQL